MWKTAFKKIFQKFYLVHSWIPWYMYTKVNLRLKADMSHIIFKPRLLKQHLAWNCYWNESLAIDWYQKPFLKKYFGLSSKLPQLFLDFYSVFLSKWTFLMKKLWKSYLCKKTTQINFLNKLMSKKQSNQVFQN